MLTNKTVINFFLRLLKYTYILLLLLLPIEIFKLGFSSEIFPAIELIIIYYFSLYKEVKYWQIFILGLLLDQFYNLPIGTSSLGLIMGDIFLKQMGKWFLLKDHLTSILIFPGYCLVIFALKFLTITIKGTYSIQGISIYFLYFTTILTYPLASLLIDKSLYYFTKIEQYVK
ncbi:MAG: hypothetical protein HRU35_05325 [Rickettsiaceae bacterium]|nr:hypothetical protein [Rickettsiaceae bacterium]